MATHPGPRPKRKDYVTKLGFDFALSSWKTMMDLYRMDKQREREQAQAERQRQQAQRQPRPRQWSKYTDSTNRDTGVNQTNFFMGTVGERDQRKKVHFAIDEHGTIVFVRDMDGTVLYDRANGIGTLPHDLNWNR